LYDKRNQLLFKIGLHSRVSEEEKLCMRLSLSASSARLADDETSAGLSFPKVSWFKACNDSDRARCIQQQRTDCLAAVFSVISRRCNFVTLGQITE